MKNCLTWLATISGLIISTHLANGMDLPLDIDSSLPPNLSPSGRIYNLESSRDSQSFQWIKSQETPDRNKSYMPIEVPEKYNFIQDIPYIHDQGKLGSCTAQAITLSMEYLIKKTAPKKYRPLSPLFVYYNERAINGSITKDDGAIIADGIVAVCQYGACGEDKWSYKDDKIKFKKRPYSDAFIDAQNYMVLDDISHSNIPQDLQSLKQTLAQGFPIIFGINVYSSFESPHVNRTGKVPMPMNGENRLGGHAMTLVGYNDIKKIFYFANSWGTEWGKKGFGSIPYDYIMNKKLTDPDDFWKIESVGRKKKKNVAYTM